MSTSSTTSQLRPPRLAPTEALILQLLAGHGEMYGLQLVHESDGELKRGTVYVTLGRMEERGLVASRAERRGPPTPGLPRRLYQPTALGLQVLQTWARLAAVLAGEKVPS